MDFKRFFISSLLKQYSRALIHFIVLPITGLFYATTVFMIKLLLLFFFFSYSWFSIAAQAHLFSSVQYNE